MSLFFKKEGYFQLFKGKTTLNLTEDKIYYIIIIVCLPNIKFGVERCYDIIYHSNSCQLIGEY